jgi:PhnB protein
MDTTLTPYLTFYEPGAMIDFLKNAFDAEEMYAMRDSNGNIGHAEVRMGDSMLMLARARGEWQPRPSNFYLSVEDVDSVYRKAVAAGGKSLAEPANQFYGDRHGAVQDLQGNTWWIATHIEDVSPEDLERRHKEWEKKQATTAGSAT